MVFGIFNGLTLIFLEKTINKHVYSEHVKPCRGENDNYSAFHLFFFFFHCAIFFLVSLPFPLSSPFCLLFKFPAPYPHFSNFMY